MVESRITGNIFDLYFEYVKETEPPAIFHRWSLIGAIGALLGRQFYLPFGPSRLFPNQYIMFVGDPGTRKSTAIKRAASLIGKTGYDKFGAQKTSMEKFLIDLQEGDMENQEISATKDLLANLHLGDESDEIPREMFIAADEFNNFLGSGNVAFMSLLGELWDWDEPTRTYKQRLKNSKSVSIYQPTVSILAGNTPSSFADCFPLASIGQGFMSRLILIHSEPSGVKNTFPKAPDELLTIKLITKLNEMRAICIGPLTVDSEGLSALDIIYRGWTDLEDSRFKHYSTRRFTHLLKLLLVTTASHLRTVATVKDVIEANTILSFAEAAMPKAIGELGKAKHAEASNKIMQALYTATRPLDVQTLWKIVQNDLEKIADLSSLLVNLAQAEKIQAVRSTTGRDGYLAKVAPVNRKQPFTNFDLLKGKEIK